MAVGMILNLSIKRYALYIVGSHSLQFLSDGELYLFLQVIEMVVMEELICMKFIKILMVDGQIL